MSSRERILLWAFKVAFLVGELVRAASGEEVWLYSEHPAQIDMRTGRVTQVTEYPDGTEIKRVLNVPIVTVPAKPQNPAPGIVLVEFTASWCQPCQNMRPIVRSLTDRGFDVREFDCSEWQGQLAARAKYNVTKLPTFIVYEQGREVARHVGQTSEAALLTIIAEAKTPRVMHTVKYPDSADRPYPADPYRTSVPVLPPSNPPKQRLPREVQAAIVRVYAYDAKPQADGGLGRSVASGALVATTTQAGLILTCEHLLSDGTRFEVKFLDGRTTPAHLLGADKSLDLAALEIKAPGIEPIDMADEPPKQGEAILSYGYGSDNRLAGNQGQLIGYETIVGKAPDAFLSVSGSNRYGDSGGPIFNTSYRLVGVQMGTSGRAINGCHCGHARNFLGRLGWRLRHPFQPPRANPYNPRHWQPGQQPGQQTQPSPGASGREPQGNPSIGGTSTAPATGAPSLPAAQPASSPPAPRPDASGEDDDDCCCQCAEAIAILQRRIAALEAKPIVKLPVEVLDAKGKTRQSAKIPLDGKHPLKLQLVPLKRN
jgi:thiol-disulfide isomerase/thioredoxin